MDEMQQLSAEARTQSGKGGAYRTRQRGFIPGVIYGGNADPESVAVEGRSLERFYGTGHLLTTLFMLDIEGKKTRVIPRQVQIDPVSDRVVHVDFMRLPEGAKIRLFIPVRFKGQETSPGLKRGGVLNIVRHRVELLCPAETIPDFLEGDLSGLEIHDSLHISDFDLPPGVVPLIRDRDFTIASVVAPTSVIDEQRAAAAAASAPAAAAPAAEGEAAAPAAGAAPAAKAPEKK
jgi:large subunit ribosomal protein L25